MSSAISGQFAQHDLDQGELNKGLGVLRLGFVVAHQPAAFVKPTQRALDEPTLGQHSKAALRAQSLDERHRRQGSRGASRSLAPARSGTLAGVTFTPKSRAWFPAVFGGIGVLAEVENSSRRDERD